ncbi:unnamed protein product, partial [Rotaria sp. Silwood1]
MSASSIEPNNDVKDNKLQSGDGIKDEFQNSDWKDNQLQNNDAKNNEQENWNDITNDIQSDNEEDDETKNELTDVTASPRPITKGPAISRNSGTAYPITWYLIRRAEPYHSWKIQAVFRKDIKFDFNSSNALNVRRLNVNKDDISPIVYQLSLNIFLNDKGETRIYYNKKYCKIYSFQLRISEPTRTWTYHYEEDSVRKLVVDQSMLHQFLFDTHFKRYYLQNPPGSSIPFWDQLCIFTYFLLSTRSYDNVESLFDQFTTTLEDRQNIISYDDLQIFFILCRKYLSNIEHVLKQDLDALELIIRMIDLLPINQENIIIGPVASLFASIILRNLSDKLDVILPTIGEDIWASFCQ